MPEFSSKENLTLFHFIILGPSYQSKSVSGESDLPFLSFSQNICISFLKSEIQYSASPQISPLLSGPELICLANSLFVSFKVHYLVP